MYCRFLRQTFDDGRCNVSEIFDPASNAFAISAPNDGRNIIQRMVAR